MESKGGDPHPCQLYPSGRKRKQTRFGSQRFDPSCFVGRANVGESSEGNGLGRLPPSVAERTSATGASVQRERAWKLRQTPSRVAAGRREAPSSQEASPSVVRDSTELCWKN